MRTELVYLWINKDENGCFQQEGFNFSPQYAASYVPETKELKIEMCDTINVFKNDKIANVTAIIGENGTGKTTLLEFLTCLSCMPLTKEKRDEYRSWNEEQNEKRTFIAIYIESDNNKFRVINITQDTIIFNNEITGSKKMVEPYSIYHFKQENYVGDISHIYLSNGTYDSRKSQNSQDSGTVNYIAITDTTLSTISHSFYHEKYGFPVNVFEIPNTPFNALAAMFAAQENGHSLQVLFDILFYRFLDKNKRPFPAKQKKSILFSIKSAWKKICATSQSISFETKYSSEKYIKSVEKKYNPIAKNIQGSAIWCTIVCNLVFELLFVFEKDKYNEIILENNQYNADEIFYKCVVFINHLSESKEKTYYKDAVKEITILRNFLAQAEYTDNLIPQGDIGKENFAQVDLSDFEPLLDHIKSGHSFLLKYLDIRNFAISSGERALLNFMSRLYVASQLNNFIPNSGFKWNESILLLIDEIDLYLHPEWQREILLDLLDAIGEAFPENYVQVIITSHSPIILSDIPRGNSIFLHRQNMKIVQAERNIQTFGANIYSLYKDAFFIKDGLAMGSFARKKINAWIEEFKAGKNDVDEFHKILELIGEPIIRKRLERLIKTDKVGAIEEFMRSDERQRILDFLKTQKAAVQQQIDVLEAQRND